MDQLITIIVVLLFFVLPAVAKALLNKQQANPQQPGNKPRPQADRTVQQEIEEFIRRATGQQNQPQAGPAKAGQARPPKKPRPKLKAQPPRAPAPPAKQEASAEAEVVEAGPGGGRVSQHVRKHLDAQEFRQRTARLGSEVALADEKIEGHQQAVFEHKLGHLDRGGARKVEAAAVPPTTQIELSGAAQLLASMLAHPDNLRQAIVLSEIFQRPEHRWE